ncbi:MAG: hypothetical protein CM1200mP3_10500 [Chloroflexota bacterium]|nr:MAG: hypothetical protein CM1200mP3_10500 [Chloroflexota bacterium]
MCNSFPGTKEYPRRLNRIILSHHLQLNRPLLPTVINHSTSANCIYQNINTAKCFQCFGHNALNLSLIQTSAIILKSYPLKNFPLPSLLNASLLISTLLPWLPPFKKLTAFALCHHLHPLYYNFILESHCSS